MPVNAVNTPTTPAISMTFDQVKTEKKRISAEINRVYNTQTALKASVQENRRESSRIKSIIQEITAISTPRAENPLLRLKNGHFKNGAKHNFIKERLYHHRYTGERRAAAIKIGSSAPEISAREAADKYQNALASLERETSHYQSKINALDEKYDALLLQEHALDHALKQIAPLPKSGKAAPPRTENTKKAEAEAKAKQQNIELFDIIYQSSSGCAGINNWLRQQRNGLSGDPEKSAKTLANKVIAEYKKRHGYEIFYKNMISERDIKTHAKLILSDISSYQEMLYQPKGKITETFRGERMTLAGIRELTERFKAHPQAVYQLGQFYSTTARPAIAESFAAVAGPESRTGVVFTLKGNSFHPLIVGHGLAYHADNEQEHIYSPLACFCVTEITFDGTHHRVALREMKRETVTDAYLMPH